MKRIFFLLPILGTLCLIACKPPEPLPVGGELSLLHKEWTLVAIGGDTPPSDWEALTLTLTDRLDAKILSSCNLGSAKYDVTTDGDFSMPLIAMTKRGCLSDERSDWETRYIEALSNANRFGVDSENLYLWRGPNLMHFQ